MLERSLGVKRTISPPLETPAFWDNTEVTLMPLAALILLLSAPASAFTKAQLETQVKTERRQYDNSLNTLHKKEQSWNDAKTKLEDLRTAQDDGAAKGKVGGKACAIERCIGKQQAIVDKREKAAEAAVLAARKQAEEYVAKENAYAAVAGHYLDPSSLTDAQDFLAGPQIPGGTTTGPGIETPVGAGCVDRFGVPCLPPGTDDPSTGGGGSPGGPVPPPGNDDADNGKAGGGAPGTKVGDLGTGHESQDLTKFAAANAHPSDSGSASFGGGGGRGRVDPASFGGRGEDPLAVARLELQRGALGEAGAAVARAFRSGVPRFEAHLLDAEVRNAGGDWAGAEAAARSAIAINPNDPRAYKALAVSLLHQGKADEALKAADAAAQLDPDDAESQMLRAFAFEGLGRKAEMMEAVKKAASLDARFLPYLELARRGKILFDRHRTAKGWHGFPIPDLEAPASGAATDAVAVPKSVLMGGGLLIAAAMVLAFLAWKKSRDTRRIKI